MPSFDIVCETDLQEIDNAVNSVMREVSQRYDFKGTGSNIEHKDGAISILADNETQLKALHEMLKTYCARRKVDPNALDMQTPESASGNKIRQSVIVKQGIPQDVSKKIVKEIKATKLKVQAAIRGEELRITGKKRDDLQETIHHLKEMNLNLPLQYINFRD